MNRDAAALCRPYRLLAPTGRQCIPRVQRTREIPGKCQREYSSPLKGRHSSSRSRQSRTQRARADNADERLEFADGQNQAIFPLFRFFNYCSHSHLPHASPRRRLLTRPHSHWRKSEQAHPRFCHSLYYQPFAVILRGFPLSGGTPPASASDYSACPHWFD